MIESPFPPAAYLKAVGPRDALAAMVRAWRRERAFRATIADLSALSDHDLRDIGLQRGDIAAGVRRRGEAR